MTFQLQSRHQSCTLAILVFVVCLNAEFSKGETGGGSDAKAAGDVWSPAPEILNRLAPPPFADAIDACRRAGGGKITVPAGTFLSGAIHPKSDVNLHPDKNATIKFRTGVPQIKPIELKETAT
ncbi:MAG: hypothetical protein ACLPYZ_06785 [Limisphaerales bacterium]